MRTSLLDTPVPLPLGCSLRLYLPCVFCSSSITYKSLSLLKSNTLSPTVSFLSKMSYIQCCLNVWNIHAYVNSPYVCIKI